MERKKEMKVLHTQYLREMVNEVNEIGIQKEDIVSFLSQGADGYYLIYFG